MRRIVVSFVIGLVIQILFIVAGVPLFSAVLSYYVFGPPGLHSSGIKVLAFVVTNIILLSLVIHGLRSFFRRSHEQRSTS